MTISRRALLKASALAPLAGALPLQAQQFPSRPIRFVTYGSPGSSLDLIARYVGEQLGRAMGVSAIVENKLGASGIIATDYVAKATPDGHTLLMTGNPHYTNTWMSKTPLPYDPLKDLAPIARVSRTTTILVVPANSPYKTFMDLIRDMKARPGEVTYATAGSGTTSHLAAVVLNDATKATARHIPYKAAEGTLIAAASGEVAFTFASPANALPLLQAGRVRGLAVSGSERLEAFGDIPTVAESGVPGYDVTTWLGFTAPGATPAPIVQRLSDEIVKIAKTQGFRDFCNRHLLSVDIADASTFRSEGPREMERWRRVIELSEKG
jgi:tripartite-type tricarboxylate transporter receptor subunit TctC